MADVRVEMGSLEPDVLMDTIMAPTRIAAGLARDLAPVRTGYLRSTIYPSIVAGGEYGYIGLITADAKYSIFVHEGTGLYGPAHRMIVAKPGRVFVFQAGGKTVFTTKIRGQRPQRFLVDALRVVFGRVTYE